LRIKKRRSNNIIAFTGMVVINIVVDMNKAAAEVSMKTGISGTTAFMVSMIFPATSIEKR